MTDEDRAHERLEQHVESLRARLGRDVEQLAHAPAVEKTRAVRHRVQQLRASAQWLVPVALGLVGGLAVLAIAALRRMRPR